MNISFRTQLIIGTTTLLCLVLIAASFVLLQEIGPSPAALLPAKRTLLLVTNMSPDMQHEWQNTLPDLQSAPFTENGPTIAALVQTGKRKEWILFDTNGTSTSKNPLLMDGEKTLSSEDSYRQLRSTYSPSSPWMFIRFPEVKLHIEGLQTPSVPTTMTIGTGSIHIAWPMRAENALIGMPSKRSDTTIISLAAARLGPFLQKIGTLLTKENMLIISSLLQTWTQEIVGPDVSLSYDVLPLLNGIGAMTVAENMSGSLRFAVRVSPEQEREASQERLKSGSIDTSKTSKHISTIFDDKFVFDTISKADETQSNVTKIGIWNVSSSSGTTTIFAENKHEWALGTEKNLFVSLISAMMPVSDNRIAMGILNIESAERLMERWKLNIVLPWEHIPGMDNNVHWDLLRQGGLAVLRINR